MFKTYLSLTKPGIIMGNAITAIGGFALASKGHFDGALLFATLLGLSSIVASASVSNNYMDRHTDQKMERTRNRALVKGVISARSALLFAAALGLLGTAVLAIYTNLLTTIAALVGFIAYVFLYGLSKYRTSYGTLIGSISGAVPPVVGYCAVSNQLDSAALILFLMIALWQMPHFYAIALYRLEDYAAASIPVLPLKKGIQRTKIHMLLYISAFIIATLMLTLHGYTGYAYLIAAALLGVAWLLLCIKGFTCADEKLWARQMFVFSLLIVTTLCVIIPFDTV